MLDLEGEFSTAVTARSLRPEQSRRRDERTLPCADQPGGRSVLGSGLTTPRIYRIVVFHDGKANEFTRVSRLEEVLGNLNELEDYGLVAFVVGDVTADDLGAACRGTLADYKVPKEFRVVDDLPKTSTQKMDKVALRDRLE